MIKGGIQEPLQQHPVISIEKIAEYEVKLFKNTYLIDLHATKTYLSCRQAFVCKAFNRKKTTV